MLHKLAFDTAANCQTRRPAVGREVTLIENDGAVGASTVTAVSTLIGTQRTIITLNDLAVSLSDTHVGGGTLIYTFPQGLVRIVDAVALGVTPTTTSTLASTLNASKTLSVGVGSVQTTTQDSGTLVTTEQNVVNAFSATSSATINVAGTGGNGYGPATVLVLDGHTSAAALYLNIGVPTATDIDADATVTVDGTIIVDWKFLADY